MSRAKCKAPGVAARVRAITSAERRLLRLLVEQFETIGACRPERLRACWDRDEDFDATLAGLYEAERLEDYAGGPMIVRAASGERLHPRLVTHAVGKSGLTTQDTERAARDAEAVAFLVGRSTVTIAALAEGLGISTQAARALVVMLVDRGLLLGNPDWQTYQVRRVFG